MEKGLILSSVFFSTLIPLLFLLLFGFIIKIYYNKISKNPEKILIYFVISFVTVTFIHFGIAFFLVAGKSHKKCEENIRKILDSTNDETVEDFIQFISTNPIQDTPNSWNRLRGVWYTVNESSDVSFEKKSQLLKLLLTKGLYLTNEEKQIKNK